MSDDRFNPYHEWLGLDRSLGQPNYYQLLGLDPAEQNTQRIAQAASRAMAQVRSCRPGPRGAQWAKLLEEVTAAASCLSDPLRRAEYDRQLGRGGAARIFNRPAPRSRAVPAPGGSPTAGDVPWQGAASAALPMQAPQAMPAGYPQSAAGTASYLDPMAPIVPAGAATPAAAPMAGGYGYPAAVSRAGASGGASAGSVPVGMPLRPVAAAPAAVSGKDRSASAKVRQRSKTSSLPVVAISAGVGMMILAGAIVLIILSQKTEQRNRSPSRSFAQNRPVVTVPSPPRETFDGPSPPPRAVRPVERKPKRRILRNETADRALDAADPTELAPDAPLHPVETPSDSGSPPVSAGQMPEQGAPPPADNSVSLPTFPAAPKLPFAEPTPPPSSEPTPPAESPPLQPKEAMPDAAPESPPPPESKPAMAETTPDAPKPAEIPADATAVKPEEVAALAKTLKAAHAAILNGQYEAAEAELDKVESLPKRPEHHAKYERLTLLAGYAKNFDSALKQAVAGLHAGDDIQVGGSTAVGFVSAAKDSITLRVAGTNRTYALDKLPAGLAVAIADRWLNKDDPASPAIKGAYLASLKDADEEHKAKARQWLQEASKKGIEGELHKVLDDTYDLEKDLK